MNWKKVNRDNVKLDREAIEKVMKEMEEHDKKMMKQRAELYEEQYKSLVSIWQMCQVIGLHGDFKCTIRIRPLEMHIQIDTFPSEGKEPLVAKRILFINPVMTTEEIAVCLSVLNKFLAERIYTRKKKGGKDESTYKD